MTRPLSIAAIAAAALLLLTGVHALRQSAVKKPEEPTIRVSRSAVDDAPPDSAHRCTVQHARFGGQRAQLIKVTRKNVVNYVVMDIGRSRDPLMRFVRNDWLRESFGDAERIWLGGFGSGDDALKAAARLCPPSLRCWPGDGACDPSAEQLSPLQIFSRQ